MTESIGFFGEIRTKLGESPLWDPDSGTLWWIDGLSVFAEEGLILGADAEGRALPPIRCSKAIGAIGLAKDGFIVSMTDGFYHVGFDGTERQIAYVDPMDGGARFNDGKIDRTGQFVSGQIQKIDRGAKFCGTFRLNHDGSTSRLVDGIHMQNATCFSPSGEIMYFADTHDREIRVHRYDPSSTRLGERIGTIDCRPYGSDPDGATVDRDGNMWVALVFAQAIACFSPEGALLRHIPLPAPFPSCPAFGGANMDRLFVTTVSDSGRLVKSDHPEAGRMMVIDGLGVQGIPETRWAGVIAAESVPSSSF